jgi:hypothetical protein
MRTSRVIRVGQVPMVFGMDWIPLLGGPESAPALARRQGASHRVLSGDPPGALGLAAGLPRRGAHWSAADLLARQHPRGTVACVLSLDAQSWHVLAAHEGVALARADRSYADPEQADQALDALRLAYPRLEMLGGDSGPDATAACLQALARRSSVTPALVPVRSTHRLSVVLVIVLCAGLALALRLGRPDRANGVPQPSVQEAWERSLAQVLAQRPIHGPEGTRALLQALYRQPVRLAGWSLQSVRCESRAGGAGWHCLGEYRREDRGADNRGLMRAAPADWRLDFPSLDRVRASWPLSLPGRLPDPPLLPAAGLLARDWASALQAVLPAFSVLRLEPPRPLPVPAPRDDQGRELPRPAGLPVLAVRTLRVEGPLRSAALLIPLAQSVSWHRAILTFAADTRPGLRASRLILHLEGAIHEHQS